MWLVIEAACPEMGKGIAERERHEQARALVDFYRKYGSLERVLFVKHGLSCIVPGCKRAPQENAHIDVGGIGRKAGYHRVVALCAHHHRTSDDALHVLGRRSFERVQGVDLEGMAAWTDREWVARGGAWIEEAKADGRYERWLDAA